MKNTYHKSNLKNPHLLHMTRERERVTVIRIWFAFICFGSILIPSLWNTWWGVHQIQLVVNTLSSCSSWWKYWLLVYFWTYSWDIIKSADNASGISYSNWSSFVGRSLSCPSSCIKSQQWVTRHFILFLNSFKRWYVCQKSTTVRIVHDGCFHTVTKSLIFGKI